MANFSDLPPRARERATALQSVVDVAHSAMIELTGRAREMRWTRQGIAGHIRNVTDARFSGGLGVLPETEVAGERQRLADLDAEITRIDALVEAQSAAHASTKTLTERIEEFLHALRPGHAMADCSIAPPSPKKGETLPDAVEARRSRVREMVAERAAVEAAPIPSAQVKQLAHEQILELAERGRINIDPLLRGDPFRFAQTIELVKVPQVGAGSVETIDAAATLAWLFRDQLTAAIDREVDTLTDDAHALSDRQRAARLEQLGREQLAVEREEAVLVEMAAAQGLTIPHRADVDVRALLGVEVSLRAEAA